MRELFVYYRAAAADSAALQAQVRALHADLKALEPRLVCRLLCRPEVTAGEQTWMETYALDSGQESNGVSAELQAEIEARAARRVTRITGPRTISTCGIPASSNAGPRAAKPARA